ncbi:MAG: hypothetical protein R3F11_31510 [Verrucomicrobiales bacterium]
MLRLRCLRYPIIQHLAPVEAGAQVVVVVEYFDPTRIAAIICGGRFLKSASRIAAARQRSGIAVDRIVRLPSGAVIVAFPAAAGKRYQIHYSSDMVLWKAAAGEVISGGNRAQWIDQGPPENRLAPGRCRRALLPRRRTRRRRQRQH